MDNEICMAVNIAWNPYSWKKPYINPNARHEYAKTNRAHECLNFNFNKKGIDTADTVYGYFQYGDKKPKSFAKDGIIIFYTTNTEINKGEIVGIYGKANVIDQQGHKINGFENDTYLVNISANKKYSMLFPLSLDAANYKDSPNRLVGKVGFTYKPLEFVKRIILDELSELYKSGKKEDDYKKLTKIYEYYIGGKNINSNDEEEQAG